MAKRFKLSGSTSRRIFRKTAGTHKRNIAAPMRGGIRA